LYAQESPIIQVISLIFLFLYGRHLYLDMEKYDLAVIGGGPAGYAAAMRAIDFGKRVILIEKKRVGGAGIYNGALSSKSLWEISEKIYNVNETITGSGRESFDLTWTEVIKIKNEALFDRKMQYSNHLTLLQNEAHSKVFTYARGHGEMLNAHEVKIVKRGDQKLADGTYAVTNQHRVIWAENIILATGSRPRPLPSIEVDEEVILTSDGIHHISDYPKSLVIVGAGVIGCEYATIFSNFGHTKVYMIDRGNRILPFEDEDISDTITMFMEKKGVIVHAEARLERMERIGDEVEYEVSYTDGRREVFRVEKALLAVGRVPNIENIGMEAVGLKMGERGRHIGDDDTQTNVPNIYAVGDVSGRIALVNMGELEARHAVERMFTEGPIERLSYDNVSTIMFLHPEVAAVGMNEMTVRNENIPVKIVKIDYSCIARAIAMRSTDGFFKIIVTDDVEMKILGMRAVGSHASSAIQAVALLIKMDKGIEELAELIHPHPAIIEGIQECVRMLLNKSVFKSSVFKDRMKCYRLVDGVETPLQRL
jgi:dihydrolipoamide dehydrogenase